MPTKPAQPTDELSLDEFVAGLKAPEPADEELSPEDFAAGLRGLVPKRPGLAGAFAGGALDFLAQGAGGAKIASQKLSHALGLSEETPFFSELEGGLRGLSQEVYPEETRGRGGLGEALASGAGSIVGSVPGTVFGGPAGAALQFGAASGVPLYYDIKAATNDEEAATYGLLFGAAVGQLEQFGAEKVAGGIVKKLIGRDIGEALRRAVISKAIGTAGAEAGTEVAEQALTDLIYEKFTGEDIDNWERMKATLPPSLLLGGAFGVLDSALQRRPSAALPESATQGIIDEPVEAPQEPLGEAKAQEATEATQEPTAQSEATQEATEGAEMLGEPPAAAAGLQEPVQTEGGMLPTPEEPNAAQGEPARPPGKSGHETEAPPAPDADKGSGSNPSEETTGVRNSVVERELERMGLEPPPKAERRRWVGLHEEAKAKLAEDPHAGSKLVKALEEKPRAVSDSENAILSFEANRLVEAQKKADAAYAKDPTEANLAALDATRKDYDKTAAVLKKSGTISGQALSARQILLKNDYSLAGMESRIRGIKRGANLTPEESAEIKAIHTRLEKAEAAITAREAAVAKREADIELKRMEREVARPLRVKRRAEEIAKIDAEIKKLWDELGEHVKTHAFAGPDSKTIVLYGKLAGKVIQRGGVTFAQWADQMVGRFGENVRPHLKAAWESGVREQYEERRRAAQKMSLRRVTKKLRGRIEEGDFSKEKRQPIEPDDEIVKLKTERNIVRREFERLRRRHERAIRTTPERIKDAIKEVLDLPRAIFSSMDLSAVRRQGGFLTSAHPFRSARDAKKMLKAFADPHYALQVDTAIRERPGHALAESAGLELTSSDEIGPQEEGLRSALSDRIPGIQASNRAYVTYLNLQRANAFDSIVESLPKKPSLDEAKAIAEFVNVATGRASGKAKKLASALEDLRLFWSPKYTISRFQLLGRPLTMAFDKRLSRSAKKAIGKEYARYVAGQGAYYALLGLTGYAVAEMNDEEFEIGTDIRSSDFGKIRVGNTRIDPLSGLAQVGVLLGRMATGETNTSGGKVKKLDGKGPFGQSRLDVAMRFLRSKAGPIPGRIIDAMAGETYTGEEVTTTEALLAPPIPGSWGDTYAAMKALGVPEGMILGAFSILGDGLATYEKKKAR